MELGLFPLGVVLLPTERLPLHIFEERYKELIDECLETDGEFGLVYADDDGLRDLGTRARVVEVLTRFEDGRLNILVEGGDRFRLTELTDGRSFNTGLVAPIDDGDDPAEEPAVDEALQRSVEGRRPHPYQPAGRRLDVLHDRVPVSLARGERHEHVKLGLRQR